MSAREMEPGWWRLPALALAVGAAGTAIIAVLDADRALAHAVDAWNQARGGKVQDNWWWLLPYHLPGVLVVGLAVGVVAALLRGFRRQAAYVALVVAIGCGLLANVVLKDGWGRPRPRDTDGLGGTAAFQQPWQPGPEGRSFPSGHVTVPAAAIALWLLWRRARPRHAAVILAVGMALSAWIGAARILSGAHWLSDLLWSVVLMAVVAAGLHRLVIRADRPPADAGATAAGP